MIPPGTWYFYYDVSRLKSSITRMTPYGGSKINITSRSDRIVSLGTTEPLRLYYLFQDAYWYFFSNRLYLEAESLLRLEAMPMYIALE